MGSNTGSWVIKSLITTPGWILLALERWQLSFGAIFLDKWLRVNTGPYRNWTLVWADSKCFWKNVFLSGTWNLCRVVIFVPEHVFFITRNGFVSTIFRKTAVHWMLPYSVFSWKRRPCYSFIETSSCTIPLSRVVEFIEEWILRDQGFCGIM